MIQNVLSENIIMAEVPYTSGESPVRKEDLLPSWAYATKKTVAKAMLNTALLMTNASQLKALFALSESSRDGFWYSEVVLIVLSIVLQVVAAVLLLVLGFQHPKSLQECTRCNQMNNAATALILLITIVNIIVAGFGIELTSS